MVVNVRIPHGGRGLAGTLKKFEFAKGKIEWGNTSME